MLRLRNERVGFSHPKAQTQHLGELNEWEALKQNLAVSWLNDLSRRLFQIFA
jgi:hypothetical protein